MSGIFTVPERDDPRSPSGHGSGGVVRLVVAATAAHAADLALTLAVVSVYGLAVEANPVMSAALSLGPLGGIAAKAALLSLICAAAALGPRYRRVLLAGALVGGLVGAVSGAIAVLA